MRLFLDHFGEKSLFSSLSLFSETTLRSMPTSPPIGPADQNSKFLKLSKMIQFDENWLNVQKK